MIRVSSSAFFQSGLAFYEFAQRQNLRHPHGTINQLGQFLSQEIVRLVCSGTEWSGCQNYSCISESDLLLGDGETNSYFITIFVSEQIYNLIIRFNIDLC